TAEALGAPDRETNPTGAWTASAANAGLQTLTLGFNVPQFASSAVIRETGGNGYLRRIEALDTAGAYTTVWQGTDPSPPGAPYSFTPAPAPTALPIKGLRLTVDTDPPPGRLAAGGAVAPGGAAPGAGDTQAGGLPLFHGR